MQFALPSGSAAPGAEEQQNWSTSDDHRIVEMGNKLNLSVKCGIKFLHKGGTKEREESFIIPCQCSSNSISCSPPQTTESRTLVCKQPTLNPSCQLPPLINRRTNTNITPRIAAEAVASRLFAETKSQCKRLMKTNPKSRGQGYCVFYKQPHSGHNLSNFHEHCKDNVMIITLVTSQQLTDLQYLLVFPTE